MRQIALPLDAAQTGVSVPQGVSDARNGARRLTHEVETHLFPKSGFLGYQFGQ
jgi:hypothetical protein